MLFGWKSFSGRRLWDLCSNHGLPAPGPVSASHYTNPPTLFRPFLAGFNGSWQASWHVTVCLLKEVYPKLVCCCGDWWCFGLLPFRSVCFHWTGPSLAAHCRRWRASTGARQAAGSLGWRFLSGLLWATALVFIETRELVWQGRAIPSQAYPGLGAFRAPWPFATLVLSFHGMLGNYVGINNRLSLHRLEPRLCLDKQQRHTNSFAYVHHCHGLSGRVSGSEI